MKKTYEISMIRALSDLLDFKNYLQEQNILFEDLLEMDLDQNAHAQLKDYQNNTANNTLEEGWNHLLNHLTSPEEEEEVFN